MRRNLLLEILLLITIYCLFSGCSNGAGRSHSNRNEPEPVEQNTQVPSPFSGELNLQQVYEKLACVEPQFMIQAPGDEVHWFMIEKSGYINCFEKTGNGADSTISLDIRNNVFSDLPEAGLMGIAFHPRFAENGYVFLSYTSHGRQPSEFSLFRVSRFTAENDGKAFDPLSEKIILEFPLQGRFNSGGQIVFGPDGFLYIATGDGCGPGISEYDSQNPNDLMGKILRIDVDSDSPYGIPTDNPYVTVVNTRGEVFALGFRSPWRFSFDRNTGALWLGDRGQAHWEEINLVTNGGNYGWNFKEGNHAYLRMPCDENIMTDPVIEYNHTEGSSVTGGYVYRGKKMPVFQGMYFYADSVTGKIRILPDPYTPEPESTQVFESDITITSFIEDVSGELYIIDACENKLYQLVGK